MPAALENCVESLLKKWRGDPGSAPKRSKADGKPLDTPEKKRSAAFAICTASLKKAGKMSYDDEEFYLAEEVDFSNPVWTGWAMTNKPHIMGLEEMSFVDENGNPWKEGSEGERLLKVPLLIMGKWRHSLGVLNFTRDLVKRLEDNFQAGLAGQDIPGNTKHKDIIGSVAWATGKFLFETNRFGKEQWSVIVRPNAQGTQLVEDKVYKYASIELHPNFQSRMAEAALSTDDIVAPWDDACPIVYQDLEEYIEEGDMPEGNDQEKARVVELEQKLADAQAALARQQEESARYRKQAWEQSIQRVVLEAENRKDEQGRALPGVFLEFLKATLGLEAFEFDGQAIQLEADSQDVAAVHAYYRTRIVQLARDLPGYVPMEAPKGEPDKNRKIEPGDNGGERAVLSLDEADAELMWQNA